MTATPTRSTAAVWRPGDPVGDRRFAAIGALSLERGGVLPDVTVAYETWGTLSPRATTRCSSSTPSPATSHVVGAAGPGHPSPGWWAGADRARRARSTPTAVRRREQRPRGLPGHDRAVVADPGGRPWGGRFPFVTIRDQVAAEVALADALGIAALARRARRLDGWHAGARVGGRPARPGRAGPGARLARRTPRPTRWPGASRSGYYAR